MIAFEGTMILSLFSFIAVHNADFLLLHTNVVFFYFQVS